MARSAHAAVTVLVAGALGGALLTGCGLLPDGAAEPRPAVPGAAPAPVEPSAGPAPTATPTGEAPTVDAVRTGGVAVPAGDRTVLHALAPADGAVVDVREDGDVTILTVAPAPTETASVVVLAAPADATLALQDDGSFVVLGADGAFLGGAARPVTTSDAGPVTVTPAGGDLLRATADGALEVRVGGRALAGAQWGEREGGRSLAVAPTPWARRSGQAGQVGVWSELVAAVPEADTPVMRDQLTCHVLGAPDKETWNLEPWRPDVGLLGVLAAACNPT